MDSGLLIGVVNDQRYLAIVIGEANAHQSLMRHTRIQTQRTEISEIDTPLREALVKAHHERFVFRPDRPDEDGQALLRYPRGDILGRIEPHGRRRLIRVYSRSLHGLV